MDEPYTPSADDVALIYVSAWIEQEDPSPGRIYNEIEAKAQNTFDRFLARVKRDAWNEGYEVGEGNGYAIGRDIETDEDTSNPYGWGDS